jgi:hypothetical protein
MVDHTADAAVVCKQGVYSIGQIIAMKYLLNYQL